MSRQPHSATGTDVVRVPRFEDSQAAYPDAYLAGQVTANRLIDSKLDRERIPFCLRAVERHLATWPRSIGKNGLTEPQHARSRGFRDTLREYLQDRSDI